MNPQISSHDFDSFFAWAPWIVGLLIYLIVYIAKRNERSAIPAPAGSTYACGVCGRRGSRDQMVPQDHGGAVGWQCMHCAGTAPAH